MSRSVLFTAAAIALSPMLISPHAQAANTGVAATQPLTCQVTNLPQSISFASLTLGAVAPASPDPFQIQCNDPNGGTFTVESQQGGLTNGFQSLDYTVNVNTTGLGLAAISLSATGTPTSVPTVIAASAALALPASDNADFQVTLDEAAIFAGSYQDTLVFDIAPN